MSESLYIRVRGRVHGPLDLGRLQSLAQKGQLSRIHEVSVDAMNWQSAANFPEIFEKRHATMQKKLAEYEASQHSPEPAYAVPNAPSGALNHAGPPNANASMVQEVSEWFYTHAGSQAGPVTLNELRSLIQGRTLQGSDFVWKQSMDQWVEIQYVPELATIVAQAHPMNPLAVNPLAAHNSYAVASHPNGATQYGTANAANHVDKDPERVYPDNPPKDPVMMAICSFLLIGLGQILLGQTVKGIVMLALCFFTLGIATLVFIFLGPLDAYLIAKKLQAGQSVGKWEMF